MRIRADMQTGLTVLKRRRERKKGSLSVDMDSVEQVACGAPQSETAPTGVGAERTRPRHSIESALWWWSHLGISSEPR